MLSRLLTIPCRKLYIPCLGITLLGVDLIARLLWAPFQVPYLFGCIDNWAGNRYLSQGFGCLAVGVIFRFSVCSSCGISWVSNLIYPSCTTCFTYFSGLLFSLTLLTFYFLTFIASIKFTLTHFHRLRYITAAVPATCTSSQGRPAASNAACSCGAAAPAWSSVRLGLGLSPLPFLRVLGCGCDGGGGVELANLNSHLLPACDLSMCKIDASAVFFYEKLITVMYVLGVIGCVLQELDWTRPTATKSCAENSLAHL